MEGHTNNEDGILMVVESYEYYLNKTEAEEFISEHTTTYPVPMSICDEN